MNPINQNWTNDDSTHAGGVSTGVGFTISWQRGPVDEVGRNGAFLINGEQGIGNREQGQSVVGDLSKHQDLPPIGGGLKPIGGEREQTDKLLPVARSLFPLPKGVEVLDACHQQLQYFQDSAYACQENVDALSSLQQTIEHLKKRRSRREEEGVLGTHELDKNKINIKKLR